MSFLPSWPTRLFDPHYMPSFTTARHYMPPSSTILTYPRPLQTYRALTNFCSRPFRLFKPPRLSVTCLHASPLSDVSRLCEPIHPHPLPISPPAPPPCIIKSPHAIDTPLASRFCPAAFSMVTLSTVSGPPWPLHHIPTHQQHSHITTLLRPLVIPITPSYPPRPYTHNALTSITPSYLPRPLSPLRP